MTYPTTKRVTEDIEFGIFMTHILVLIITITDIC